MMLARSVNEPITPREYRGASAIEDCAIAAFRDWTHASSIAPKQRAVTLQLVPTYWVRCEPRCCRRRDAARCECSVASELTLTRSLSR